MGLGTERHRSLWLALRVLDEPTRVFSELSSHPRSLVPILLVVLVSIGAGFAMPAGVFRGAAERQLQVAEERRQEPIPPADRQEALTRAGSDTSRLLVGAAATLNSLFTMALTAGVLLLAFNAVSGAEIRFNEEWAIVTHAFLAQTLGVVLTVAAIVVLADPGFQIGLGFLVSEDQNRFLHNLANQFTFFGAWNVYLLALGNRIRVREKSMATPLFIVGGLWLVVNLVAAGLATAFASLVG